MFRWYEDSIYQKDARFHTSIKPYQKNELLKLVENDQYQMRGYLFKRRGFVSSFIEGDILNLKKDSVHIEINPVLNVTAGKDFYTGNTIYENTRGLLVQGTLGHNFYFHADFRETQTKLPEYVRRYSTSKGIIPGLGNYKTLNSPDNFDFAKVNAYISWSPSRFFNFMAGHSKHFIGDGYRSLILSDVSSNYPFLKITTTFWNIKLVNLFAEFQDLTVKRSSHLNAYQKKYGSMHYLDWHVSESFSFGFFEAIMWQAMDSTGAYRGFDINYLNPVIMYRPVEFGLGSPDNALIGLNAKYVVSDRATFYGQFILDEFKFDEITSRNQWWANKYGFQIGLKSFAPFGAKGLRLQAEYNQVRPYTYSHYVSQQNYGHNNQSLAHPIGANFREGLVILRYHKNRFFAELKNAFIQYGADEPSNPEISYGQNIFKSNNQRPSDYGIAMLAGIKTDVFYTAGKFSWLINSNNNMNLMLEIGQRKIVSAPEDYSDFYVSFGIRTSLYNEYRDF